MTDNALAIIEEKNVAQYFVAKGLDPVIEAIKREVTGIVSDISTKSGRDEIRSRAAKLAKTKVALDELGKKLTEDQKKQIKAVDAERARAWDALDALQKEVRAPLTEWENKDKERIAAHEAKLAALTEHPGYGQHESAEEIGKRLVNLENMPPRDWEEFEARATRVLAEEIARTKSLLAVAQKREADRAELERLRQEQAAREQKKRDERIKAEAAQKARLEAEERARKLADQEAARVKAEQEAAELERRRLQREADDAAAREEAAKREAAEAEARAQKAEEDRLSAIAQAEADRKAVEEKAESDRIAAAAQAQREADAAAQREREKIAEEKKREADAAAAREADKAHRAKINREAMEAILKAGAILDADERARAIVTAIAKGQIPHVKINY